MGKSSLINKLCSRKNLARVSSTPGKTATINFYSVDDCYFVDLPGYGYAKVSNADRERWDDLINSYFEAPRHHTLLVQLLDCRHAPSADDEQMLRYLHYHQIPYVVALTKADKLKKSQLAKTLEDFENFCRPYGCQKVVLTSGENGYGIPELQAVLNAAVAGGTGSGNVKPCLQLNLPYSTMNSTARPITTPCMPTSMQSSRSTASTTASLPTLAAAPVS